MELKPSFRQVVADKAKSFAQKNFTQENAIYVAENLYGGTKKTLDYSLISAKFAAKYSWKGTKMAYRGTKATYQGTKKVYRGAKATYKGTKKVYKGTKKVVKAVYSGVKGACSIMSSIFRGVTRGCKRLKKAYQKEGLETGCIEHVEV